MIPFNQPPIVGTELTYIQHAMASGQLSGNGYYTKLCEQWLETQFSVRKALLTPSCTSALEMAAILLDIGEGDEVIMPSYTFVSTANAFALRGAKIVFVDIRPDTMNIDETKIEQAITPRTKVIVPVHYAGVACEMDSIMTLAEKYQLYVVEDSAQGVMSFYKGRALGSIGHIGCYSFHETKNVTAGGEGGAILINDDRLLARSEIVREKGTDRNQFFRGQVDKYTWRDLGSSFMMSELQAAYLYAQFEMAKQIQQVRNTIWRRYYQAFLPFAEQGLVELPSVPENCQPNAHLFYLKWRDCTEREAFISWLAKHQILAVFHYVPLHQSEAGKKFGFFAGEDRFTTQESERLVRLPLFYNLSSTQVERIINVSLAFLQQK